MKLAEGDLPIKQHVWSVTYIDELIQTAVNEDPLTDAICETVYYAATGPNYNVIGLFDASGAIAERYEYTPYGERRVYTSAGLNDPKAYAPLLMSKRVEQTIDLGGDLVFHITQPFGIGAIGHQGLMHDEVTGLVYNRARMLSPRLGRFLQRDPLNKSRPGGGYQDGMNLYAAYHVMRGVVDPSGRTRKTCEAVLRVNCHHDGSQTLAFRRNL